MLFCQIASDRARVGDTEQLGLGLHECAKADILGCDTSRDWAGDDHATTVVGDVGSTRHHTRAARLGRRRRGFRLRLFKVHPRRELQHRASFKLGRCYTYNAK
ncbi:hypothetical protein, partial [Tardiphaga sp.]|uniref:hypothetical protein n=1 Tax=Tardiphaga sp. TaxID=1926292 RepID=UPI00352B90A9